MSIAVLLAEHVLEFLCERYGDLCFKFQGDPVHVWDPYARLLVFRNDYYTLFEVWGAKYFESQYHASMELLEHGLKMGRLEFFRFQSQFRRSLAHQYPPSLVRSPDESPTCTPKLPERTANNIEPVSRVTEKNETTPVQVPPSMTTPNPDTTQPEIKRRTYKRKRATIETEETNYSDTAVPTAEKGEASPIQAFSPNATSTPEISQPEKKRRTYKRKGATKDTAGTNDSNSVVPIAENALLPRANQATPNLSHGEEPPSHKQTPSATKQPKQPRKEKVLSKTPKTATPATITDTPDGEAKTKKTGPTFTKTGKRLGRPPKRQRTTSSPREPQPQVKTDIRRWATIPGSGFADRLQKLQKSHTVPAVPLDTYYQRRRLCFLYGQGFVDASNLERTHNARFSRQLELSILAFCNLADRYRNRRGFTYDLASMAARVAAGLSLNIEPLPARDYTRIGAWSELWNRYISSAAGAYHDRLATSGRPSVMNEVVGAETVQLLRPQAREDLFRVLLQVRGMMQQGEVF
ncbi:hypothetical protein EDD36DRAFT_438484 [Exophiala viscosa]|uniref:Uncharacterized protein n=1 Tax=Exophiala viscosa TaxID=2486360 RepID=A0AAN6ICS1_9EURO|nr:hypothetical protein EDD36DRAFT_438484 [Exophiala viscosa]